MFKFRYTSRMRRTGRLKWYKRARRALIKSLGGKCVDCRYKWRLEFDHKYKRERANEFCRESRLARYRREADDGLVELRCRWCNAKKGRPKC